MAFVKGLRVNIGARRRVSEVSVHADLNESLRMVQSSGTISAEMKQTACFRGRASVRLFFSRLFLEGLPASIASRMPCECPKSPIVNELHRFAGPLLTRTLCSGIRERSAGREQRTEECHSSGVAETSDGFLGQDEGYQQGDYFGRRSEWPWINVVPSEAPVDYSVIGPNDGDAAADGKQTPYAGAEAEGSLHPSAFPFIRQDRDPGFGNVLHIYPMPVPVKIGTLLRKYGWSAHTLLELRTLMAMGTKIKPRHVLEVLSRHKDAEVAYNFLAWALDEANCRLHISCFTVVLLLLGRVRKYDLMEKLLEDLDKRGYLMDRIIFTAAMRRYAEGQRMEEALSLFVKMKARGLKPDCITYSVLMQMLSKAKLYHEAINLYEEMLAEGVATDTQVYTCVVRTFGKAGRLDLAYEKLEEMRTRGHIPDQFTYGVLLEGYARAGRPEFMDLYREMKSAGVPVNEVIFNIMFSGIEHIGTLSDAESLFADMEHVGLSANLNAFAALIGMCSKTGDAEGAQRWFDRMTSMKLNPTLAIANSLLDSYGRAKQFDRAKEILDSFQNWGLTPELPTLNVCMRCLSRCVRPADLKTVQGMLSCHSGGHFVSEILGSPPEKDLAPVIASFFKSLHFERRQNRREFMDSLIDYLYKNGFRSQAYEVLEGALANYVFPGLVEQGAEGICSVNLRGMELGTAIIALTHTLPRLAKQFHRKEMTPAWVQIYTVIGTEEVPVSSPTSVHQSVHALLRALHSPFRAGTLQTGGGFVGRGEEVMHWLDEPQIRAMLAFKH